MTNASIRVKSAKQIQPSKRNAYVKVHEDCDLNLATKLLTMEAKH